MNIKEIIKHSNWIESVYSKEALEDAMRAWKYARANMEKIDIPYILKIHYLLMRKMRPDIAGKLRNCDVWIGGHRKYFVSHALLLDELKQVVTLINVPNFDKGKEAEYAKHCHVLFEQCHVFEDGNGRVGRILFNIHRIKLGLKPLLIEGPAEGKPMTQAQFAYYLWFK